MVLMVAKICDINLKPAKSLSAIKAEYEQRIVVVDHAAEIRFIQIITDSFSCAVRQE